MNISQETLQPKAWGPHKLIIFDADKTLRRCTVEDQPCPNRDGEWELMHGVVKTMRRYPWNRIKLGVASNQAGVHFGYLTASMAYQLLEDMVVEATGLYPPVGSMYICPHDPKSNCRCRKPAPGMLIDIMNNWEVAAKDTLFVGDMESDKQAARAAYCDFQHADDFFGRTSTQAVATR